MEPESLELIGVQALAGETPEVQGIFPARCCFEWSVSIRELRFHPFDRFWPGAMAVYAFTARDGEQPGRESAAAIELGDALERFNKGVLRHFPCIGRVTAELGGKGINAMFEAVNDLL